MKLTPYQRNQLVPIRIVVFLGVFFITFLTGTICRDYVLDFHGDKFSPSLSFVFFVTVFGALKLFMWIACMMLNSWTRMDLYTKKICYQCGYDVRYSNGECPECGLKWNKN